MLTSDPRYATFPPQPGAAQLRWLIEQAAAGAISAEEMIRDFRQVHEALERQGRVRYASRDEARLIWDVLWALEFYSPDPARESSPEEWYDAAAVLAEVRRVAAALQSA